MRCVRCVRLDAGKKVKKTPCPHLWPLLAFGQKFTRIHIIDLGYLLIIYGVLQPHLPGIDVPQNLQRPFSRLCCGIRYPFRSIKILWQLWQYV